MGQLSRALVGFIRGGSHPRAVGWAVYLGALAGFATGMNLSVAALLHLAILLNVHTRTFLLVWGGAAALSWSLTPVTLRIGQFLLDRTPLGAHIATLGESSVIALLDWDRYTLLGGVALAGLGALPIAGAAARFVQVTTGAGTATSSRRVGRSVQWPRAYSTATRADAHAS